MKIVQINPSTSEGELEEAGAVAAEPGRAVRFALSSKPPNTILAQQKSFAAVATGGARASIIVKTTSWRRTSLARLEGQLDGLLALHRGLDVGSLGRERPPNPRMAVYRRIFEYQRGRLEEFDATRFTFVACDSQEKTRTYARPALMAGSFSTQSFASFLSDYVAKALNLGRDQFLSTQSKQFGLLLLADPPFDGAKGARTSLRRRAALLASTPLNKGLSSEVLWTKAPKSECDLTSGSIFIPKKEGTKQASVFAAVASAIQELRTRQTRRLEAKFPFSTIVDPNMYLGGRFNDGILKAAILRASTQDELTCSSASGELERFELLATLADNRKEGAALNIELALASAVGKLPALSPGTSIFASVGKSKGGGIATQLAMLRSVKIS